MNFKFIHYGEDRFDALWNRAITDNRMVHPFYSFLLRNVDHQIMGKRLIADDSFVVLDEANRVIALVPLYRCADGGKAVYGSPETEQLAPVAFGNENSNLHQMGLQTCFHHIEKIAGENNIYCHSIYYTAPTAMQGGYFYNPLLPYGYVERNCAGWVLSLEEEDGLLWRNVRKSYRPLINKAMCHYYTRIVDADNYQFDVCEEYRKLHFLAAGRETRPKESFHSQYQLVKNRQGFIVFIMKGNQYAGAYFFYYLNECAFYASAATIPGFDPQSGVGHLGLWRGIQKAKELGVRYMDFGKFFLNKADGKLFNIEFYKMGFGGRKVIVFRGTKYF